MSRRIEIELTSDRPDGTWTWRAAGALKPRGVVDGSVLHPGAKPGDVVRAEADFEMDGITILSVLAPKDKRAEPARLEVVGSARDHGPGVTTSLVEKSERRGPRRTWDRGDNGAEAGSQGRQRRDTASRPSRSLPSRDGSGAASGADTTVPNTANSRRQTGSGGPSRADRTDRPTRADRADRPARADRPPRESRPGGDRSDSSAGAERSGSALRSEGGDRSARASTSARGSRPRTPDSRPDRPDSATRTRRLSPGNVHRNAVLESLPAEQRPIAEQVLKGGIPAVRTALHLEREKAQAEGRAVPNTEALLAMAEQVLPVLEAARWKDRADAAAKAIDDISLAELRSVVAGTGSPRDAEGRELAATLREGLERRQQALVQTWVDEMVQHLDEGSVVRALRLSTRPPEPSTKLPAELASRLSEAAGLAMSSTAPSDRWAAVLDAVAASPVRRSVKPQGIPSEPGEALLHAARQQSGRVPALAALLGITMPPPPGPVRAAQSEGSAPTGPARPSRRRPDSRASTTATPTALPVADAGEPPATSDDGGQDTVDVQELSETVGEG